jgi:hypothetical protein
LTTLQPESLLPWAFGSLRHGYSNSLYAMTTSFKL